MKGSKIQGTLMAGTVSSPPFLNKYGHHLSQYEFPKPRSFWMFVERSGLDSVFHKFHFIFLSSREGSLAYSPLKKKKIMSCQGHIRSHSLTSPYLQRVVVKESNFSAPFKNSSCVMLPGSIPRQVTQAT